MNEGKSYLLKFLDFFKTSVVMGVEVVVCLLIVVIPFCLLIVLGNYVVDFIDFTEPFKQIYKESEEELLRKSEKYDRDLANCKTKADTRIVLSEKKPNRWIKFEFNNREYYFDLDSIKVEKVSKKPVIYGSYNETKAKNFLHMAEFKEKLLQNILKNWKKKTNIDIAIEPNDFFKFIVLYKSSLSSIRNIEEDTFMKEICVHDALSKDRISDINGDYLYFQEHEVLF